MKQASITLKLAKHGHDVYLKGVTPLEAMLLVAEHHRNSGEEPIVVDQASVTEAMVDVKDAKGVTTKRPRTEQEEIDRLRTKYAAKKVTAILAAQRDFPADFVKAVEAGVKVVIPNSPLIETRLI